MVVIRAFSGPVSRSGRRQIGQAVRNRPKTEPPPIRGWNTRDPISEMKADYAPLLDNWFPAESSCYGRRGYRTYVTGLGSPVETLMTYQAASGLPRMFAAAGGAIYETTASGVVGASLKSGLISSRFQHVLFATSSGLTFLPAVNGYATPIIFNGTTWSNMSLTGISDPSTLINIDAFKKFLVFVEKNSTSFWYLPVDSISGTLSEFDLGPQFKRGGHLVATGTWTRDAGSGPDDFFVAVSSEGEVAVYQGTDPSSADTWAIVGVFRMAKPLGRRCMINLGSDLVVMTEDGFSKLSQFLAADRASNQAAISDLIAPDVRRAVNTYKTNFGWQPILYPRSVDGHSMLIFNIPEGASPKQFVSNSTTGAWCRFTGLNALCWVYHNDGLFFGDASGNVCQADYGTADSGSAIQFDVRQAYSYMRERGLIKKFNLVKPSLTIDGPVTALLTIDTDFKESTPTDTAAFSDANGVYWDEGDWDDAEWADKATPTDDWQDAIGEGDAAALRMRITTDATTPRWNSTSWLYEVVQSAGFI